MMAAVSAKSVMSGDRFSRGKPPGGSAAWPSVGPFWMETRLTPGMAAKRAKGASPMERFLSLPWVGDPAQTMPTFSPDSPRSRSPQRATRSGSAVR